MIFKCNIEFYNSKLYWGYDYLQPATGKYNSKSVPGNKKKILTENFIPRIDINNYTSYLLKQNGGHMIGESNIKNSPTTGFLFNNPIRGTALNIDTSGIDKNGKLIKPEWENDMEKILKLLIKFLFTEQ